MRFWRRLELWQSRITWFRTQWKWFTTSLPPKFSPDMSRTSTRMRKIICTLSARSSPTGTMFRMKKNMKILRWSTVRSPKLKIQKTKMTTSRSRTTKPKKGSITRHSSVRSRCHPLPNFRAEWMPLRLKRRWEWPTPSTLPRTSNSLSQANAQLSTHKKRCPLSTCLTLLSRWETELAVRSKRMSRSTWKWWTRLETGFQVQLLWSMKMSTKLNP